MEHTADGTKVEDLPEDVVCRILSLLDMRDAARASVSCSTFLRGWGSYPRLTFDEDTLRLRLPRKASEQEREEHARGLVRLVDAIVTSRHRSDAALEAVSVRFPFLQEDQGPCVDRWVRFALAATTTRRLELDFYPDGRYNCNPGGRLRYDFPCSLLSAGTPAAAALEHLFLRQGTLVVGDHHPPPGLINLASLVLSRVNISSDDLDRLLSSCHKLQSLELERCGDLTYVRVSPPPGDDLHKHLKFLAVKNCWSISSIDVSRSTVQSLQLAGHNLAASLLLGSEAPVPTVTSASIDLVPRLPGTEGAFTRLDLLGLAGVLPGIETLFLSIPLTMLVTVHPSPNSGRTRRSFHRLRRADLKMNMLGRQGRNDFIFLHQFLDAAPAMQALSLDVSRLAPAFEALGHQSFFRNHPRLPHHRLQAFDFIGFDADLASLELVLYILQKARALRRVSLKHAWTYEEDWSDDEDDREYYAERTGLIREAIAKHIVPAVQSMPDIELEVN